MKNYLKSRLTDAQIAIISIAIAMLITGFVESVLLGADKATVELNYAIPLGILVLGIMLRDKIASIFRAFDGRFSTLIVSSVAVIVLGVAVCLNGTECMMPLLIVPIGLIASSNKEREGGILVFALALFGTVLLSSLMSFEISKKIYSYGFIFSSLPIIMQTVLSSEYKYEKNAIYKGHCALDFASELSICLFVICFLLYSAAMKSEVFNILSSFLWIAPSLPKIFSEFEPLAFNTAVGDPSLTFLDSTGEAFGYIAYIFVLLLMLAFFVFGLRLRKEKKGIWQDVTVYMLLAIFMPMLCSSLYTGEVLLPFFSNSLLCNTVNAVLLVLAAFSPKEGCPVLAIEREFPSIAGGAFSECTVFETRVRFYSENLEEHIYEMVSYFPEEWEDMIYGSLESASAAEISYVFGNTAEITKYLRSKQFEDAYVIRGNGETQRLRDGILPKTLEEKEPDNSPHKGFREEAFILSIYK